MLASVSETAGRFKLPAVFMLFALAIMIHWNSLQNGFCRDDLPVIVNDPLVSQSHDLTAMAPILRAPYWQSIGLGLYRPLTTASFVITVMMFGLNPWWFHFANLLLHGVNAALAFLCLQRIAGARTPALIAACLFAVHPLQSEVVAAAVGRADLMATGFALSALFLASAPLISASTAILAGVLMLCSLLSKESAIGMPLMIIGLDWLKLSGFRYQQADPTRQGKNYEVEGQPQRTGKANWKALRARFRQRIVLYSALIAAVVCYFTLKTCMLGYSGFSPHSGILFLDNPLVQVSSLQRFFALANCAGLAAWRLAWPLEQCPDYSYRQIQVEQLSLAGGAAIAGLLVMLIFVLKTKSIPSQLKIGALIFIVAYLPVSNWFVLIGTIFADRLLYFPSIGYFFAVSMVFRPGAARWQAFLTRGFFLVFCLVCGLRCFIWDQVWADNNALFQASIHTATQSAKSWYNWGTQLRDTGKPKAAVTAFESAIKIYKDYKDAHYNLAALQLDDGQYWQALMHLDQAAASDARDAEVFNLRGVVQQKLGHLEQAKQDFQHALALDRNHFGAATNAGLIALQQGDFNEALRLLQQAKAVAPESSVASFNLALAYERSGDDRAAGMIYRQELDRHPLDAEATLRLCDLTGRVEGAAEAVNCLQTALASGAPDPRFHFHLAEVYRQIGDPRAESEYERFLAQQQQHDESWQRAQKVLAAMKEASQAKGE